MKNIEIKTLIWLALLTAIPLWLGILYYQGIQPGLVWVALKQIPTVVTCELILWLLFVYWLWQFRVFHGWLVKVPVIKGRWKGHIKSTWQSADGMVPDPIPTELIVTQTLVDVSCTMKTKEMVSNSITADFIRNQDGTYSLLYTYMSVPNANVRDRSAIHYGSVKLEILCESEKPCLKGSYWTDRKSTGDIFLEESA